MGHYGENGGSGGVSDGGGISVAIEGDPTSPSLLVDQTTILKNTSRGGDGAAGGSGLQRGGYGGVGASAYGGGLDLEGQSTHGGVWTLTGGSVGDDVTASGSGGAGGGGIDGGGGANSDNSDGGGIYDGFPGTLQIYSGMIFSNSVVDARGGAGGPAPFRGSKGKNSLGYGGGLYIARGSMAAATTDTQFKHNVADKSREWYGKLGKLN